MRIIAQPFSLGFVGSLSAKARTHLIMCVRDATMPGKRINSWIFNQFDWYLLRCFPLWLAELTASNANTKMIPKWLSNHLKNVSPIFEQPTYGPLFRRATFFSFPSLQHVECDENQKNHYTRLVCERERVRALKHIRPPATVRSASQYEFFEKKYLVLNSFCCQLIAKQIDLCPFEILTTRIHCHKLLPRRWGALTFSIITEWYCVNGNVKCEKWFMISIDWLWADVWFNSSRFVENSFIFYLNNGIALDFDDFDVCARISIKIKL